MTFNVGDILENEEKLLGKIVAIDEDNVTIHWETGENVVEEIVSLSELAPDQPLRKIQVK